MLYICFYKKVITIKRDINIHFDISSLNNLNYIYEQLFEFYTHEQNFIKRNTLIGRLKKSLISIIEYNIRKIHKNKSLISSTI